MTDTPDAPEPGIADNRDWTTVLDGGCEECGYRPHDPTTTRQRLTDALERWTVVLRRQDAARRPAPRIWSPLEYGGHCRDLIEVLGDRVTAMLDTDAPTYADFDGAAAVQEHEYWRIDADLLTDRLAQDTARTREILTRVGGDDWQRTGLRGDGYTFTVASLCQYIVHDVEHHLFDVRG